MCDNSVDMWKKLHSVYEQRSEQRQDRLFNQFFAIKEKEPLETVAKHIAKLEKIWVELQDETWKEDQVKLPESLFVNSVLNTLPSEYFEIVNAWESVPKDQRKLDLLRERLCTVELRLNERSCTEEIANGNSAYVAKTSFNKRKVTMKFRGKCSRCGL